MDKPRQGACHGQNHHHGHQNRNHHYCSDCRAVNNRFVNEKGSMLRSDMTSGRNITPVELAHFRIPSISSYWASSRWVFPSAASIDEDTATFQFNDGGFSEAVVVMAKEEQECTEAIIGPIHDFHAMYGRFRRGWYLLLLRGKHIGPRSAGEELVMRAP